MSYGIKTILSERVECCEMSWILRAIFQQKREKEKSLGLFILAHIPIPSVNVPMCCFPLVLL